jgi:nitroreductase
MKSTLANLKERRSCRSYLPDQITDQELDAVLEAGAYAPTGRGFQSPVLVAIQDPALIGQLERQNAAIMGTPEAKPFYGAPTVVVVLADKSRPTYLYDGSCALCNMLNAAHALGLGSCWIHRAKEEFDAPEGKALLKQWGLEGEYEGIGHCLLGYPDGELPAPKPRKADHVIRIK